MVLFTSMVRDSNERPCLYTRHCSGSLVYTPCIAPAALSVHHTLLRQPCLYTIHYSGSLVCTPCIAPAALSVHHALLRQPCLYTMHYSCNIVCAPCIVPATLYTMHCSGSFACTPCISPIALSVYHALLWQPCLYTKHCSGSLVCAPCIAPAVLSAGPSCDKVFDSSHLLVSQDLPILPVTLTCSCEILCQVVSPQRVLTCRLICGHGCDAVWVKIKGLLL